MFQFQFNCQIINAYSNFPTKISKLKRLIANYKTIIKKTRKNFFLTKTKKGHTKSAQAVPTNNNCQTNTAAKRIKFVRSLKKVLLPR